MLTDVHPCLPRERFRNGLKLLRLVGAGAVWRDGGGKRGPYQHDGGLLDEDEDSAGGGGRLRQQLCESAEVSTDIYRDSPHLMKELFESEN